MRFLVVVFTFLCAFTTFSQGFKTSAEIGVYGGGSYYIGDLNRSRHFVDSKLAGGLIFRYNLSTRHSLRFTANYGNIYAFDSDSPNPQHVRRNLSFRSQIIEIAAGVELDLFKYRISDMKFPISPYFFYQIAYTRINPKADINGNEIALQPLGTEGQGTPLFTGKREYGLNQLAIPLGIGLKFNLRPRLAMSIEYGIRKTFTDYLDDVSGTYVDRDQLAFYNGPLSAELSDRSVDDGFSNTGANRGSSANKDWYSFYGIMITIKPFKKDICDMRGWR